MPGHAIDIDDAQNIVGAFVLAQRHLRNQGFLVEWHFEVEKPQKGYADSMLFSMRIIKQGEREQGHEQTAGD